ncbi:hypothetical protein IQ238_21705 [Pleurocapsales cyanobacterium LEGE 06147]|nr:hypothetical protein [Pleurocapsales cyanobacterium LEGE 06147]
MGVGQMLPHAAGFIDAIFSVGLIQTFTVISPLAATILSAIADQDFSSKKLAPLAKLQQEVFDYNDKIANYTYASFKNFNLLNAWLRIWILQHMVSVAKITCTRIFGLALDTIEEKKKRIGRDLLELIT